ncbi:MAG: UDP-N-acetylenolpyruvoylglucosamine reductase [Candidatus Taylorbacteria bacterium RIFCSPHIGHO2_02_FULL_45_28]|uniref:UDP-N-acetylenolpyruvoylglucosamine reductase n=1 Tax=Candidatus Taylorbacteria bacterium RIFCSPHIGHO2_12_FULL_45_16 TaxID=1802315 RepID=A0A1G2N076_9BACT|nr:MAG: UDP-N-acetylenolpyruvoylglucosamine reductase [Candidatus Taylorbacteria bacterium RIFCSPHIGHO2_01_FULL_44_110]OHA25245.1 MAG: UDP-N-acetylenolpyruvoylglucosamine reductase [Candidatus Taylorbacteria bacterium RIFCSPHIGHO2_02_FULL_45_28]OHA29488.1 MAG: UDP-N-acetylenolpyruvoylglucosamine reductase [Candidatus Taylorbacteria bacterium RIFCSPHIGHO2_12_FULL_45_16]OHA33250.1 MAG: UDP-N-acetylenolpyruvoylglucosamine reductase [Candidatus Taylorbacteria bacterium RIFCSPLOWO2_01_FULL_45_59]OHA
MIIQEHITLAPHTTFKIGGPARFFCSVSIDAELLEAVTFARNKNAPIFILGGGSNILIDDQGFDGLVIKIEMMGMEKIQDLGGQARFKIQEIHQEAIVDEKQKRSVDEKKVIVSVAAGERWDDFVDYAVEHGLYGIENLSAIPGTVGAAPVQNIGAYGAEVSQTILAVHALDTRTMKFVGLTNGECQFSYRESLFRKEKGHYIITRVDFALGRRGSVNTEYKDVQEYFLKQNITSPTLKQVRQAITDIRWGKLPDWKLWGTAGSFFKNPIISAEQFLKLKKKYPELPGYPEPDGRAKVSLGWILDKVCNARGLCKGNVCVYEKQALVLIAKPGATSEEVVVLAQDLMRMVKEKTGIVIEGEVEWVN